MTSTTLEPGTIVQFMGLKAGAPCAIAIGTTGEIVEDFGNGIARVDWDMPSGEERTSDIGTCTLSTFTEASAVSALSEAGLSAEHYHSGGGCMIARHDIGDEYPTIWATQTDDDGGRGWDVGLYLSEGDDMAGEPTLMVKAGSPGELVAIAHAMRDIAEVRSRVADVAHGVGSKETACIVDGSMYSPSWRALSGGSAVWEMTYDADHGEAYAIGEAYTDTLDRGLDNWSDDKGSALCWDDGCLFLCGSDSGIEG